MIPRRGDQDIMDDDSGAISDSCSSSDSSRLTRSAFITGTFVAGSRDYALIQPDVRSCNNLIWAADPVYRGIKTTFRGTEYIGYHAQGLRGAFDVDFHDETWWVKGVSGQGTPAPLLGVSGQQAASEQEVQDLTEAVIVIGVVLGLANAAASPYNKKQAPKGDGGGMVSEGVNLKNYNRQPSRDQVEGFPPLYNLSWDIELVVATFTAKRYPGMIPGYDTREIASPD
eukprot:g70796.t1